MWEWDENSGRVLVVQVETVEGSLVPQMSQESLLAQSTEIHKLTLPMMCLSLPSVQYGFQGEPMVAHPSSLHQKGVPSTQPSCACGTSPLARLPEGDKQSSVSALC